MTTALSMGMIKSRILSDCSSVIVSDPYPKQLANVQKAFDELNAGNIELQTTTCNQKCVDGCDVVFLGIKPQSMEPVMRDLNACISATQNIVSMLPGIALNVLQNLLSSRPKLSIIRIMPNTPALIGGAAISITKGPHASIEDLELVQSLLEPVGLVTRVEHEAQIDAVTGLSGSGPAYVYMLIEAMADGGVNAGLPRDVALKMAAQTVYGAANMVLTTGQHPAQLKDAVASPGGTTIAGIRELESHNFRFAVMSAVETAAKRAHELGQKK